MKTPSIALVWMACMMGACVTFAAAFPSAVAGAPAATAVLATSTTSGTTAAATASAISDAHIHWTGHAPSPVVPLYDRRERPVFLRELYSLERDEDYQIARALGFNAVIGHGARTFELAARVGFQVTEASWYHRGFDPQEVRAEAEAFRHQPWLISYNLNDEPDLRTHIAPPAVLDSAQTVLRQYDPGARTSVTLAGTPGFAHHLPAFARVVDIVRVDPYPLIANQPLDQVRKLVEYTRQSAPGKPVVSILQAWTWPAGSFPTGPQLQQMAWQSLIAGAAGLSYFDWNDAVWCDDHPDILPAMAAVNHWIAADLEPFLVQAERYPPIADGDVYAGLWRVSDEHWRLLAVRLDNEEGTTRARFALPDGVLHGGAVYVHTVGYGGRCGRCAGEGARRDGRSDGGPNRVGYDAGRRGEGIGPNHAVDGGADVHGAPERVPVVDRTFTVDLPDLAAVVIAPRPLDLPRPRLMIPGSPCPVVRPGMGPGEAGAAPGHPSAPATLHSTEPAAPGVSIALRAAEPAPPGAGRAAKPSPTGALHPAKPAVSGALYAADLAGRPLHRIETPQSLQPCILLPPSAPWRAAELSLNVTPTDPYLRLPIFPGGRFTQRLELHRGGSGGAHPPPTIELTGWHDNRALRTQMTLDAIATLRPAETSGSGATAPTLEIHLPPGQWHTGRDHLLYLRIIAEPIGSLGASAGDSVDPHPDLGTGIGTHSVESADARARPHPETSPGAGRQVFERVLRYSVQRPFEAHWSWDGDTGGEVVLEPRFPATAFPAPFCSLAITILVGDELAPIEPAPCEPGPGGAAHGARTPHASPAPEDPEPGDSAACLRRRARSLPVPATDTTTPLPIRVQASSAGLSLLDVEVANLHRVDGRPLSPESPRPATIHPLSGRLDLDGTPWEQLWEVPRALPPLSHFLATGRKRFADETHRTWFASDGQALLWFIDFDAPAGVRAQTRTGDHPMDASQQGEAFARRRRDASFGGDDMAQLAIGTPEGEVFLLQVNANGAARSARILPHIQRWVPQVRIRVRQDSHRWQLVAAIPLHSLNAGPGSDLRLNVGGVRSIAPTLATSWNYWTTPLQADESLVPATVPRP